MLTKESAAWGRTKSDRAAADREQLEQAAVQGLPARMVDAAAAGPPLEAMLGPMEQPERPMARTLAAAAAAAVKPGAKPEPE